MCELNVIDQVKAVTHTTIVQDAWARGQELAVHGWVYGLEDGLVKDLGVRVDDSSQVPPPFRFLKAANPQKSRAGRSGHADCGLEGP